MRDPVLSLLYFETYYEIVHHQKSMDRVGFEPTIFDDECTDTNPLFHCNYLDRARLKI